MKFIKKAEPALYQTQWQTGFSPSGGKSKEIYFYNSCWFNDYVKIVISQMIIKSLLPYLPAQY
jgi:hypothetical protein